MKKVLLAISLLLFNKSNAQTYVAFEPTFYNIPGTIADRSNISIELGHQWEVFSLGFDIGKTNMNKTYGKDTTTYFELRPNLNVFQQGKFTNTLTIGLGWVPGAQNNFVTEFTSGIEYDYSPKISFNIYFGQYYFYGKDAGTSPNFIGMSIMRYFKSSKTKGLIK